MNSKFTQGLLVFLIITASIGGAVFMVRMKEAPEKTVYTAEPPIVRTITLTPDEVQVTVTAFGAVAPQKEITLSPEVSGKIIEVYSGFHPGGVFEKNAMLFRIDPKDYEAAVDVARLQLAQAELRFALVEAEASAAASDWKAAGKGKPAPLAIKQPQLTEAKAALEAARSSLERAERSLEKTEVRAPFTGRIADTFTDAGQITGAGAPAAVIFATDTAEVRLPIPISEFAYLDIPIDYNSSIHPQSPPEVIFTSDAGSLNFSRAGRIVRTEGVIDPKSRMITAVAQVDSPYSSKETHPLASGLFVKAEIKGRTVKNIFLIPRAAVRGRSEVLIIDTENRIHFREIGVFRAENERVIANSGIEPGEILCLTPLETAVRGMKVQIINGTDSVEEEGGQ